MNRKLKPPKPPKFKRKEYKVPDDLKYVVVTNPWSRPPTESVPEYMKERFANAIGGWFERMTGGKRDLAIYFVRTQSLIIVELSNFDNLAIVLGAHHTRDFSTNPTLDVISEIYEYDYKHHGSPRSILQWTSVTPQYAYRDLERLPLKRDYPPPRVPQSNRPPQFAVGLSEDVRDMIGGKPSESLCRLVYVPCFF
ncbi:hypothetical protein BDP27DRAFT_1033818 [Rhodocollybia butyracea]|uniref:Uncharacterized protein n=1 Tax=Rhodocollybia butyracea TaxID=206335 RepID=A0A9P5Q798_9AGAR|nr:hypothetical protein BDP27DRAFT_1033818 [Rhodocollybia butyracea]